VEKYRKAPHVDVLRAMSERANMNIHSQKFDRDLTPEEAAEALALLRQWAGQVTDEEIAALDPLVSRLVPGKEVSKRSNMWVFLISVCRSGFTRVTMLI